MSIKLTCDQQRALTHMTDKKNVFITGSGGTGKCHGFNTPIMMYTGNIKMVQDIKVGDQLMGDDSNIRNVLSICKGKEDMYKIKQVKGDDYIVNESHILSLVVGSTRHKNKNIIINGTKYKKGEIIDISVKDYLNLSNTKKKSVINGYKVPIIFKEKQIPIDPYLLGIWLGDGHSVGTGFTNQDAEILKYLANKLPEYNCYLQYNKSANYGYRMNGIWKGKNNNNILNSLKDLNLINNKHIPDIYKYNSRENQLKLLAGLLDTDGYYNNDSNIYEIIQKNRQLAEDINYISRCLGFTSNIVECKKSCTYKEEKREGTYYKQSIYGKGIEEIPCLIKRKQARIRQQIKNNLYTGITIEKVEQSYYDQGPEYEYYYGFEIDGNHRFLLGDHTVAHNSKLIDSYYDIAIKQYGTDKVYKTSTTGVSALLIGGKTIHSWAGIMLGNKPVEDLIKYMKYPIKLRWRKTKVLFIDEISMLSPELFDKLNEIGKVLKGSGKPFGGIQIIISGDFFQLPVVKSNKFCFEAETWNEVIDETVNLKKIIRQSDEGFQKLLNEVRLGICSDETANILRSRVNVDLTNDNGIKPTRLFPKNNDADKINLDKINRLIGKRKMKYCTYKALFQITFNNTKKSNQEIIDKYKNAMDNLIPDTIVLSVGSQIMFKKNIDEQIANGTRGVIVDLIKTDVMVGKNMKNITVPKVRLLNGTERIIGPESFSYKIEEEFEISKIQIPLKLAWASTIHSSQGMTLDCVEADIGENIFEYGQAYVVLSRVKSLEGLSLIAFNPHSIMAHPKVLEKFGNIDEKKGIEKYFRKLTN